MTNKKKKKQQHQHSLTTPMLGQLNQIAVKFAVSGQPVQAWETFRAAMHGLMHQQQQQQLHRQGQENVPSLKTGDKMPTKATLKNQKDSVV